MADSRNKHKNKSKTVYCSEKKHNKLCECRKSIYNCRDCDIVDLMDQFKNRRESKKLKYNEGKKKRDKKRQIARDTKLFF